MELEELKLFRSFAEDLARQAGKVTLTYFGEQIEVNSKSDATPVTIADRETELLMRRVIEDNFPEHGIIGEEFPEKQPCRDCSYSWVLDPIDGTKSFIHGVPLYTTLLSLLEDGDPILGVIFNPYLDELTSGAVGLGAHCNNQTISVSDTKMIDKAWLQLTDPTDFLQHFPETGTTLIKSVGFTRTWADGHGYALVARGDADIMIDPVMNLWDVACLKPIIEEAGGIFTDLSGRSILGSSAIASNKYLHSQVLELLNKR